MTQSYTRIGAQTYPTSNLLFSQEAERKWREAFVMDEDQQTVRVNWTVARQNFRKTAKLSVSEFCKVLAKNSILSQTEALDAAKGNWPQTFADAISVLSEDEQFDAQVRWAAADTIDRSEPLLTTLAQHAGVSEEQLDEMFGYDGQ